jgi:hypothetical protein
MFKRFLFFLFIATCFSACQPTLSLSSETLSPSSLIAKKLFILTYDTELSRSFVISTKNYLALALENQKITVEKINISAADSLVSRTIKKSFLRRTQMARYEYKNSEQAIKDFETRNQTFQTDFVLTLKAREVRSLIRFHALGRIEIFRGVVLDINLKSKQAELWRGQLICDQMTATDETAVARQLANHIIQELKKAKFIL